MEDCRVYLRALEPDDYRVSIKWRKDDEIWDMLGGTKYFVSEAYEKQWVEKAIFESNLGYTPNNDGETIRIVIPALTEERRVELTKQVKAMAEEGKVSIRNIRREAIEDIEKLKEKEEELLTV